MPTSGTQSTPKCVYLFFNFTMVSLHFWSLYIRDHIHLLLKANPILIEHSNLVNTICYFEMWY